MLDNLINWVIYCLN